MDKKQPIVICIGILFILQLTFVDLVQAQNIYHNEKWHFSFTLPERWEEYPKETMDKLNARILQLSGGKVRYESGFHKTESWECPHFYLQIDKSGKWSESQIQESIIKYQEIRQKVENELNSLPSGLQNTKIGSSYYDNSRNIFFMRSEATDPNLGKRLGFNATILSNYGAVGVIFASPEKDFDNDLVCFKQIVESFKFDKGYNFQESSLGSIFLILSNPSPKVIMLIIVGLVAGVLYFVKKFRK